MRITPRQGGIAVLAIIIGIVVILAFLGAATAMVYKSGDENGYDRATREWKPKVARAELERDQAAADRDVAREVNRANLGQLETLKADHKQVADAVKSMALEKTRAEVKLRQAMLKVAETEKRLGTERQIRRLLEIAGSPTITEGACDEADAILRDLAARE